MSLQDIGKWLVVTGLFVALVWWIARDSRGLLKGPDAKGRESGRKTDGHVPGGKR